MAVEITNVYGSGHYQLVSVLFSASLLNAVFSQELFLVLVKHWFHSNVRSMDTTKEMKVRATIQDNTVYRDAEKGLKQVGDVHRNAHLHPYFTLMCN